MSRPCGNTRPAGVAAMHLDPLFKEVLLAGSADDAPTVKPTAALAFGGSSKILVEVRGLQATAAAAAP
jgi:hypothetical protein